MSKQLKAGPVTVVVVMAPWCGHCHEFEPILDKAAATPKRSVQVVKVKDDMLDAVNQTIQKSVNSQAKPIEVEGYPSAFLVGKDGNVIQSIEAVKDEDRLRSMMEKVGPIAEESLPASPTNSAGNSAGNSMNVNSAENSAGNSMNVDPVSPPNMMDDQMSVDQEDDSLPSRRGTLRSIRDMSPEEQQRDAEIRAPYQLEGGSLYGALSRAAYTLAPTAVLLGAAGALRSRTRRGNKGRRHGA